LIVTIASLLQVHIKKQSYINPSILKG